MAPTPAADGLLAVRGKPPYATCVVGEPLRGEPDVARGATAKADAADAHGAESDGDAAERAPDAPASAVRSASGSQAWAQALTRAAVLFVCWRAQEHAAQAEQMLTMFHDQPARWCVSQRHGEP